VTIYHSISFSTKQHENENSRWPSTHLKRCRVSGAACLVATAKFRSCDTVSYNHITGRLYWFKFSFYFLFLAISFNNFS